MFNIFIAIIFFIYLHVQLLYGLIYSILLILSIIGIYYLVDSTKECSFLEGSMDTFKMEMMMLELRLGLLELILLA